MSPGISFCNEGSIPVCAISDNEARQSTRASFEDRLRFFLPEFSQPAKT